MIAVVIPVRNGAATIDDQVRALAAQDYDGDWCLIVADNGSTDATVKHVRRWEDRLPVQVVDAGATPGINRARNAGVRAAADAGATVVVLCDADDVVAPGWLAAMAEASQRWDAWGGRLVQVGRHWQPGDPLPELAQTQPSAGLRVWRGYLPGIPGGNMGVAIDAWHAVGGFDESFTSGGDDTDFSWRLQRAGFRLGRTHDAVVYYRMSSRLRDLARQRRRWGREDPHLYRKHRAAGMPRTPFVDVLRKWGHLIVRAPRYLSSPEGRRRWVASVARFWGRIEGSIRYRSFYL